VGMLFNPTILVTHPREVLGTLFIILIGKSIIGFFVVVALGRPLSSALTISAALAQIGEFSFILAALGIGLGLMPPEGQSYILAGAILSIIINPILMFAAERARPHLEAAPAGAGRVEPAMAASTAVPPSEPIDERHPTTLAGHAVLIGYGRVGTVVAEGLSRQGTPFVVIEDSESRVAAAHAAGIEVVVGNAASGRALALANVKAARTLFVAIPNAFEAGQAVEQGHKLNPQLQIIARAHADEEVVYLRDLGATQVIMGEREIGLGMLEWMSPIASAQHGAESVPVAAPMAVASVTPTAIVPKYASPKPPVPVMETAVLTPLVAEIAPTTIIPSDPRPGPLPPPGPGPVPVPEPPPQPRPKPPPRVRPLAPASTAASPFNPEVVPSED
jgi:K+:H+ antiporter